MNPTFRTLLIVLVLFAVVVLAAILYTRSLRTDAPTEVASGQSLAELDLHPELTAGREAFADGRLEDAKAHLAEVPPMDPGYLLALRQLGLIHTQLEEFEAAQAAFGHLAAIEPGIPQTHMELAWVQFQMDHYVAAELSALRALEIDASAVDVRYAVGLFRVAQGEIGAAIDVYHRVIDQDGDRERATAALQDLLRFEARHPEIAEVHYALAFFAKTLDRRELEIEELERYLAMNPRGPTVGIAEARLDEAQKTRRN